MSGFATTLAYVEAGLVTEADDDRHRARYLLEQLGLTGDEDPATLSGGEARRAALARVLAPSPDILLLDEPTNHLDLPGIEWLERELAGMRSGIVLISHDRRLLERLSRATVWLDRGITRTLDRGFAAFEAWRDDGAGAGGERAAQARAQDRHGGGLAALRRHRAAQAQPEAAGGPARAAQAAEGAARAAGHGAAGSGAGGPVRAAGHRWPSAWRNRSATGWWCATSPPASCAATGSASSAPTAPARRRC